MDRVWANEDYRELCGYELVELLQECERITAEAKRDVYYKTSLKRMRTLLRTRNCIQKMEKTAQELDEWLVFCRAVLSAFRKTSRSLERMAIEHLEDHGFKLLEFVHAGGSEQGAPRTRAKKMMA